jgi:hypothetical protein
MSKIILVKTCGVINRREQSNVGIPSFTFTNTVAVKKQVMHGAETYIQHILYNLTKSTEILMTHAPSCSCGVWDK